MNKRGQSGRLKPLTSVERAKKELRNLRRKRAERIIEKQKNVPSDKNK